MIARERQMSILLADGRIRSTSSKLDTFVFVKDYVFKHMFVYKSGSSH